MKHILTNWKKYLMLLIGVIIAGASALGYIPPAVAEWLKTLLSRA